MRTFDQVLGMALAATASLAIPACKQGSPAPRATAPRAARARTAEPAPAPAASPLLQGKLASNQTLAHALSAHGVTPNGLHEIVAALHGICDFRSARPGAHYELRLGADDAKIGYFRFENGPLDVYEVGRAEDDTLSGHRIEVALRTVETEVSVEVKDSLYNALEEVGESPELVALLVDVFAWDIDFYQDQRPGDRFRLIVDKQFKDSTFVQYGRILAAEYSGAIGTLRTFYYRPAGAADGNYFLEDGRSARRLFLATPLQYTRVSSGFGYRMHPILGYARQHLGVDYAAPPGTPVRAMAGGTVTFAGRAGGSGIMVTIAHGNGLASSYAHLSRIAANTRPGVRVKQKQVIGAVGSTGLSTGPHLHFAVKLGGRSINPQSLKQSRMEALPPGERHAFAALVAQRAARLLTIATPNVVVEAAASVVAMSPTRPEGVEAID